MKGVFESIKSTKLNRSSEKLEISDTFSPPDSPGLQRGDPLAEELRSGLATILENPESDYLLKNVLHPKLVTPEVFNFLISALFFENSSLTGDQVFDRMTLHTNDHYHKIISRLYDKAKLGRGVLRVNPVSSSVCQSPLTISLSRVANCELDERGQWAESELLASFARIKTSLDGEKGNLESAIETLRERHSMLEERLREQLRWLESSGDYWKRGVDEEAELSRFEGIFKRRRVQGRVECSVCGRDDAQLENPIIECEGCLVCVHKSCYQFDEPMEKEFFCDACASTGGKAAEIRCFFCPMKGGALKKVNIDAEERKMRKRNPLYFEGYAPHPPTPAPPSLILVIEKVAGALRARSENPVPAPSQEIFSPTAGGSRVWTHLSCLYWSPELCVQSWPARISARHLLRLPKENFSVRCGLCGGVSGSCVRCAAEGCRAKFHIECARLSGGLLDSSAKNQRKVFCVQHNPHSSLAKLEAAKLQSAAELKKFAQNLRNLVTGKLNPPTLLLQKRHSAPGRPRVFNLPSRRVSAELPTLTEIRFSRNLQTGELFVLKEVDDSQDPQGNNSSKEQCKLAETETANRTGSYCSRAESSLF